MNVNSSKKVVRAIHFDVWLKRLGHMFHANELYLSMVFS